MIASRTYTRIPVLLLAILILAAATAVRAEPDPTEARRFISDGVVRSMLLYNKDDLTPIMVAERIGQELDRNFDLRTIAIYALGSYRQDLTGDQKSRYMSEFRTWIKDTVTRFVMNLQRELKTVSRDMITITGTTPVAPDQIVVHTRLNLKGGETARVDWRLRQMDERFLVLDMMIYGISQLELFRSQFEAIMARKSRDIETLIADLKARNAQLASR